MKNQKLYFILSAISAIISAILALVTIYLNETQLTGTAVNVLRSYGDTAGVQFHYFRQSLQDFTSFGFLIFLALFIIFLIIGIVKKIKSK